MQTPTTTRPRAELALQVALILAGVVVVVGLVALVGGVDLLKPAGAKGTLGDVNDKIEKVDGPATAALVSLSGLGLIGGGAMTAVGMSQGIKVMTMSGGAGFAVVIGRGLIE